MAVPRTDAPKGRAPKERVRRRGRRGRRPAGDGLAANPFEPQVGYFATGCVAHLPALVCGAREETAPERQPPSQSPAVAQAAHSGQETRVRRDHDHGNPQPGRPTRSGTGMGKGNDGDSRGSHRCSCSISAAEAARRGTRTMSSSPRRKSLLSHPSPSSFSARCARSACCSRISARTSDGSMGTSAGGFAPIVISCPHYHGSRST